MLRPGRLDIGSDRARQAPGDVPEHGVLRFRVLGVTVGAEVRLVHAGMMPPRNATCMALRSGSFLD